MDVEERLEVIGRKVDKTCLLVETLTEKVEERTTASDQWRSRVESTVWGLNGDASNSMVIRLDRLEQTNSRQTWVIRVATAVIVTGFVGALWSLIAG